MTITAHWLKLHIFYVFTLCMYIHVYYKHIKKSVKFYMCIDIYICLYLHTYIVCISIHK